MIFIVLNSLGRGGAERSVLLLLEQLLKDGIQAKILCLFSDINEYEVGYNLKGHVECLNARSYWLALWRLFCYLLPRRSGLLFSLMPQSNIAAVCIGKLLGMRTVTSERTTPLFFYRTQGKLNLALLPHIFSSRAVFLSDYALRHGLPSNRLGKAVALNAVTLHNPVPVPVHLDAAISGRSARLMRLQDFLNADSAPPLRLLLVSRLVEGKGILEFLELVSGFVRKANVQIDIAGTGPLALAIRQAATRLKIADKLVLRDFISDIYAAYAQSDIVVLTSESEGFGRVGFEAYQAGCLVVGTYRNSFWDEVVAQAPVWARLENFSSFEAGLQQLATNAAAHGLLANGDDICEMREALSVASHTKNFLSCIGREVTTADVLDYP